MFLAIILACALLAATISLWALDSPLGDRRTAAGGVDSTRLGDAPASAEALPDLDIDDASVRAQDAEEESASPAPDEDEQSEDSEPSGGDDGGGAPDRTREEAVLALVNDERAAADCGPLEPDSRLDTAARLHAEDMAANDYFDHTSQDGRSPTDRAAEQGYEGGVGENIAYGYPDPASVMEGWMNSEGHRANILNCGYNVLGVGTADRDGTIYWVQNFG